MMKKSYSTPAVEVYSISNDSFLLTSGETQVFEVDNIGFWNEDW